MAVSTIKSEPRFSTILNTTSANGTYSLMANLNDVSELIFQLVINGVVRCSVTIVVAQFKAIGAFPDFTLGTLRGYCDVAYVSDTSIRISNSTLSNVGGGIRIIAR